MIRYHLITKRTRKLGWGYTTAAKITDNGQGIAMCTPERPTYTGTISQILEKAAKDKTYRTLAETEGATGEAWFYDGKRIVEVEEWGQDNARIHDGIISLVDWQKADYIWIGVQVEDKHGSD